MFLSQSSNESMGDYQSIVSRWLPAATVPVLRLQLWPHSVSTTCFWAQSLFRSGSLAQSQACQLLLHFFGQPIHLWIKRLQAGKTFLLERQSGSCRKGGALHGYHAIAPCRIKPHKSYNSMAQQIVVRAATNTLRTQSTNMALPLYVTAGHKQTLHSVPHIRNPEWFSQAKSMSNTDPNAVFKMGKRSNRLTQIKFCKVWIYPWLCLSTVSISKSSGHVQMLPDLKTHTTEQKKGRGCSAPKSYAVSNVSNHDSRHWILNTPRPAFAGWSKCRKGWVKSNPLK